MINSYDPIIAASLARISDALEKIADCMYMEHHKCKYGYDDCCYADSKSLCDSCHNGSNCD